MNRPVTPQEAAALARTLLAEIRAHPVQGIVVPRCAQLVHIIGALDSGAYPTDENRLIALSLVPYTFQEANYDDIDWCEREASKLRQLQDILEIDFLVQMAGKRRADASDEDMTTYRERSFRAIKFRKTK